MDMHIMNELMCLKMWGTFYGHSAYIQKNTCQNLVSEHSIEGGPASLYNLAKSAPDHFVFVFWYW